jgi:hypothetical protein
MKFTRYFQTMRQRPDRSTTRLEWIEYVIENPVREVIQEDGRIRRWASISEMDGRFLRVILLEDGETVDNAFFDRTSSHEDYVLSGYGHALYRVEACRGFGNSGLGREHSAGF